MICLTSVVVVMLLFYVHGKDLRSYQAGQFTLSLGRLRPPKRLISTYVLRAHTFASN